MMIRPRGCMFCGAPHQHVIDFFSEPITIMAIPSSVRLTGALTGKVHVPGVPLASIPSVSYRGHTYQDLVNYATPVRADKADGKTLPDTGEERRSGAVILQGQSACSPVDLITTACATEVLELQLLWQETQPFRWADRVLRDSHPWWQAVCADCARLVSLANRLPAPPGNEQTGGHPANSNQHPTRNPALITLPCGHQFRYGRWFAIEAHNGSRACCPCCGANPLNGRGGYLLDGRPCHIAGIQALCRCDYSRTGEQQRRHRGAPCPHPSGGQSSGGCRYSWILRGWSCPSAPRKY